MTKPDDFDTLFDQVQMATDEIRRLKEAQRLQILSSPEVTTVDLDSAIDYWQTRKNDVEGKLRLMR